MFSFFTLTDLRFFGFEMQKEKIGWQQVRYLDISRRSVLRFFAKRRNKGKMDTILK